MSDKKQDRINILNAIQMDQKITRMAHEIYENNFKESELVFIGITTEGAILADRIVDILRQISPIQISNTPLTINKKKPLQSDAAPILNQLSIKNKTVILVDDVLNSGKTLMYVTKFLLDYMPKSIQTACLVDRKHREFPIRANYVGLSLSTTLKEHITVQFTPENLVYLV